jgi:hypothetical protein
MKNSGDVLRVGEPTRSALVPAAAEVHDHRQSYLYGLLREHALFTPVKTQAEGHGNALFLSFSSPAAYGCLSFQS